MENSEPALSLYVHIPFCKSKCIYCDFFSVPHPGGDVQRQREARVTEETIRQARLFGDALQMKEARTVYVGGGTPSMLSTETLTLLLEALRGLSPAEWTVEANPESLGSAFLEICTKAGVSRLSVGIQTTQAPLLTLLERPGTREDTEDALGLLRGQWRGDISLDFLAGIPGQSAEGLLADLASTLSERVGHVSLYSLTVEDDTELERRIAEGRIRANPPDLDEQIWLAGKDALEKAGYRHYEVSNFARPGKECLHNLGYWRLEPYLGVGPGAVSTLPAVRVSGLLGRSGAGPAGTTVVRVSNPHDLGQFLRGEDGLWGMQVEEVGDRDFLLESLMMGLRTAEGISAAGLERRFGRSFAELFPGVWERWVENGTAAADARRIRLTPQGRLFLNRHLLEIERAIHSRELPPLRILWP